MSVFLNTATELSHYTPADVDAYLARIGLPARSLLNEADSPTLALLERLLRSHHFAVPYDTTALHIKLTDWTGPSKLIEFGTGTGHQLGEGNFDRIVRRGTGGYCYALNTAFAGLLRSFSFAVSELGARCSLHRAKDPRISGYSWSLITHEVLVVTTEDGKRYLVDVGYGGGSNVFAMPLEDGATTPSLSPGESFQLVKCRLPIAVSELHLHPDSSLEGYLLSRFVPTSMTPLEGYFTPCYHFEMSTMSPVDIAMANFYNEKSPEAAFARFFAVSRLLPNGARRTLAYGSPPVDMASEEGTPLVGAPACGDGTSNHSAFSQAFTD